MDVSVYHYDAVDSTNTQCRRLAAEGVVNAVVTADCQTAGRGRMGRSFQSPPGLGLYLSVLWRTGLRTGTLPMVTPLAAVATPPVWKVRMVSWVPGSPMDCAAMMPTASPGPTGLLVARFMP